ncbi:hypothetical protein [Synechococcus phage BUCT-ZZ01]|nr:hypothetical protein [Synechococcus phage BUCT-ZZ01]
MASKKKETAAAPTQPERDPILDKEVTLTMTVENLNVILTLLGKLPFEQSNQAIGYLRDMAMRQLAEKPADPPADK